MTEPAQRYAEDLTAGTTIELGEYLITYDEIVAFAEKWDPQPFHVDHRAATAGFFGEIIASGIQTVGVFQRLAVLAAFNEWQVIAGRSLRDVQFRSPVRPGMTLRGEVTITSIESTRPDRSLVTMTGRITHAGNEMMSMVFDVYVRRRP